MDLSSHASILRHSARSDVKACAEVILNYTHMTFTHVHTGDLICACGFLLWFASISFTLDICMQLNWLNCGKAKAKTHTEEDLNTPTNMSPCAQTISRAKFAYFSFPSLFVIFSGCLSMGPSLSLSLSPGVWNRWEVTLVSPSVMHGNGGDGSPKWTACSNPQPDARLIQIHNLFS